MWGRNRSPADQAADAVSSTLDDMKMGAIKGAATGALSALGARVSGAAKSAGSANGDLGAQARKAQQRASIKLAQAAAMAMKRGQEAGRQADLKGKSSAATTMLQALGDKVGEAQKNIAGDGVNIHINPNDVPRVLRGMTLLATGLGTLFAPGSSLDASKGQQGDGVAAASAGIDTGEIAEQARQGIDTAATMAQQRIKDMVELAKDTLTSLSDALTAGIETAESKAVQALDQTEARLTAVADQAAEKAKDRLPEQKRRGGGMMRWLLLGVAAGGLAAFFSSPFSGSLGERIANLRRDLGLGGDDDDDSQYWPSPPQQTSATETDSGAGQNTVDMKTEAWNASSTVKESTDKA